MILTLIGQTVLAQKQSKWTDIDTLKQFPNKTLVEYKAYTDSNLRERAQAFLIPIVQEWPKYRFFGNLFTTEVQLDSIVFHGQRTSYLDNQYHKTEKFENGNLISTTYFDSDGQKISEEEFENMNNVIGPCGIITGHYFYHGQNRKKKN